MGKKDQDFVDWLADTPRRYAYHKAVSDFISTPKKTETKEYIPSSIDRDYIHSSSNAKPKDTGSSSCMGFLFGVFLTFGIAAYAIEIIDKIHLVRSSPVPFILTVIAIIIDIFLWRWLLFGKDGGDKGFGSLVFIFLSIMVLFFLFGTLINATVSYLVVTIILAIIDAILGFWIFFTPDPD